MLMGGGFHGDCKIDLFHIMELYMLTMDNCVHLHEVLNEGLGCIYL